MSKSPILPSSPPHTSIPYLPLCALLVCMSTPPQYIVNNYCYINYCRHFVYELSGRSQCHMISISRYVIFMFLEEYIFYYIIYIPNILMYQYTLYIIL